ncbi:Histidine kinase-like ATPase domain-containing protein [Streptomyces indicus]|uniref:Histidine kinase-like ATPase domain-containing protein n=2 Tax=Streptomyces indicus TaxID=417292 RepID=A0A1G9GQP6_9ACTN|nr:Histidine kinase-like ATPase domain-containing protein [Streptomyces indicus]
MLYAGSAFDGRPDIGERARKLAEDFLVDVRASGVVVPASAVGALWVVVSELLANASRHAAGPCVLELQLRGQEVEIGVWDTVPGLEESVGGDQVTGTKRGLAIVRDLSSEFHVEPSAGGKRVLVRIPLAP